MASVNFQKCKTRQQVYAILRHCDKDARQKYSHSNEHIDKSKSSENTQFSKSLKEAYDRFKDRISQIDNAKDPETGKNINTNKRKDRVECFALETAIPDVPEDQRDQWAKLFMNLLVKKFSTKNIVDMYLHKDEEHFYHDKDGNIVKSKWHIHALVVPERGGKLDGKSFSSRQNMMALNKELDKMTREHFGVKYMTGETPQNKTVEELKRISASAIKAKEIKSAQLDTDIEFKQKQVSGLDKSIVTLKAKKKTLQGEVEVLQNQVDGLKANALDLINRIETIHQENADVIDIFARSQLAGVPDRDDEIKFKSFDDDGEYGDI